MHWEDHVGGVTGDSNMRQPTRKEIAKDKHQETCSHEFVSYKTCCYCGYCENYMGEIVSPYVASNVKELSEKFSEWYFGIKEQTGNPPLAMQIFYWFSQRTRVNIFEYEEEIKKLEGIIELKEVERKRWADMCIKKQTTIESVCENLTLGNAKEAFRVAKGESF